MPETELSETSRIINEKWFADGPGGKSLAGCRCRNCGRVYFPRKRVCVQCFESGHMEPAVLSRRGKIYTFTVAEAGPPGYTLPYAYGYIDLPEGVRLFSLLGGDPAKLAIGAEVEMTVERIRRENGVDVIGYVFTPV